MGVGSEDTLIQLPRNVDDIPTAGGDGDGTMPSLTDILTAAANHGASDIHLRAGSPPLLRVTGELVALQAPSLSSANAADYVRQALAEPDEREAFARDREYDFALTVPAVGRFRGNAYRTRGAPAMVLRRIHEQIPRWEKIGLPVAVRDLASLPDGLALVVGPTGSGKSTTLAAMVAVINDVRRCHILTIEDPIEFLFTDNLASISQREVLTDTADFATALRAGMRQDPDVIVVGEIRDLDTLRTALRAAETGHLVLASMHARTAVDAVHRIVDMFPIDEQRQARMTLSEVLRGIVCQRLVPATTPGARRVVTEVAVSTPRVVDAIREPEHTASLIDIMAEGQYYGMYTLQQDAVRLVLANEIPLAAAEKAVTSVADLHVALKRAGFVGEQLSS